MTDLFGIPESLSPKEAWKRTHNVETHPPVGSTGRDAQWVALHGASADGTATYGEDEEHALYEMSKELGVKFYKP